MNDETVSNLSDQTEKLIGIAFAESLRAKAIDILRIECGNNLPFCDNLSPTQLERIRFAAIKTSGGSLDKLKISVNLAKTD